MMRPFESRNKALTSPPTFVSSSSKKPFTDSGNAWEIFVGRTFTQIDETRKDGALRYFQGSCDQLRKIIQVAIEIYLNLYISFKDLNLTWRDEVSKYYKII